jgi:Putative DNA-binding domain
MFKNKKLIDITLDDVQELIDSKIPESLTLDYKESLPNEYEPKYKDKTEIFKEIAKDITGLANTNGGYLIYGVSEINNLPDKILGIPKNYKDKPVSDWFASFMTGGNVLPNVNYKTKSIPLNESEQIIFILEIPESFNKPHMVKFAGSNCYYKRFETSTEKADHYDIKNMFEFKNNILTQFSDFKKKLNLNEDSQKLGLTPISSKAYDFYATALTPRDAPILVVNITPYNLNRRINFIRNTSFDDEIKKINQKISQVVPINPNKVLNQYGSLYCNQNFETNKLISYLQVYKNGSMEYCDTRYMIRSVDNGPTLYFAQIVNLITSVLFFQIKFSELVDSEEWNIQVTFPYLFDVNLAKNYDLSRINFNQKYKNTSLMIEIDFTKQELNESGIKKIVKEFSDQLFSSFGLNFKFEDLESDVNYGEITEYLKL